MSKTDTPTRRQCTDATNIRLMMSDYRIGKTEPTENAVEKAEDVFGGYLRLRDYSAHVNFRGDLQPERAADFVDYVIRAAMDNDRTTYDDNGMQIYIENTTDLVDVLRALKVITASARAARASNLYVGVSLCGNDIDNDSIRRHRTEHRLLRRAVAILETRLAARARELSRECSRIRRALAK